MPLETDDSLPSLYTQETPLMVLKYDSVRYGISKPGDAVIFIDKFGYNDERVVAKRRGIEPFRPYTLKAIHHEKKKIEIEEYPGLYSRSMFRQLRSRKAFFDFENNICTFVAR